MLRKAARGSTARSSRRWRQRYGLNEPLHIQYLTWMHGILTRADFGYSFEWNRPVLELCSTGCR